MLGCPAMTVGTSGTTGPSFSPKRKYVIDCLCYDDRSNFKKRKYVLYAQTHLSSVEYHPKGGISAQMNFNQQNAFYCRRDDFLVPISLPLPIREEIERSLTESVPMGKIHPPLLVACPLCVAVYPCTVPDLRLLSLDKPDPRLDLSNICTIRARRPCGTSNCGFLAEIHTIAPVGAKLETLLRIAEIWNFRGLCCPECHASLAECLAGDYLFDGFESLEN